MTQLSSSHVPPPSWFSNPLGASDKQLARWLCFSLSLVFMLHSSSALFSAARLIRVWGPWLPKLPSLMTTESSEHANATHDGNNTLGKGHSRPDSGTWGNCNTHSLALCTHSKRWALPQNHLLNNVFFFSQYGWIVISRDCISVLVILIQLHNKNEACLV